MTVRLLTAYNGYPVNAIVSLNAGTEAGLIAAKQADSNLAGGTVFQQVATQKPGSAVPYILAQSAVPVILLPAGTFNASGQLTLGTALPYVPSGVVQVYLFAGNGLNAGLYPATFSSTTVCQLVGNPVTTAGAYTGGTTAATLASITVPGGAIGPSGALRCSALDSLLNNANAKTIKTQFGGVDISSNNPSSSTQFGVAKVVRNRGAQNAQVCTAVGLAVDTGNSGSANQVLAVDTSQNQSLTFTAQLSVATDYIILEGYTVEVLPGA